MSLATGAGLKVLVNGLPCAAIAVADRGLQYGDGVFETLRCERGTIRWFERHLARLRRGCARLAIPAPEGPILHREALSLLNGNVDSTDDTRAMIKIIVTRGTAVARGYRPSGAERPNRIVSLYPWSLSQTQEFAVGLSAVRLGCNPLLAGIKHLNRLEQVLAQQSAAAAGYDEVLMCVGSASNANTGASSEADEVVCASAGNLFALIGDELCTPSLVQCGVEGIMRELVLQLAPQLGLAVRVGPITVAALSTMRSMWVSNVRLGMQPVHWYEGRRVHIDARGLQMQELINATHR